MLGMAGWQDGRMKEGSKGRGGGRRGRDCRLQEGIKASAAGMERRGEDGGGEGREPGED